MNLYESKTWKVVFGDWDQSFPGYTVVSCSKERLSDLTDNDWVELGKIEKELERITKKLFNATMYNFACLMNNAYRDKEKETILNKEYKDKHFGYNFWKWDLNKFKKQKDIYKKEEKQRIYEMMKKEWSL